MNGPVYIRVTDTDRSRGNRSLDTLYVDELFIRSEGSSTEPPLPASNPDPINGATGFSTNVNLSWTAGSGATSHDVYFGTDPTPDSTEFQGNQAGTTFDPGTLAASTTYYWQVDEVNNNGTTSGPVWNFTTGAALPNRHVSAITTDIVAANGPRYKGQVVVTIIDSSNSLPVSGATVSGTFSGDFNESVTGTTNGSGQVTLTSNGKKKLPITYIFCVDNVSESGHTYAPGNNIETCDSY